MGIKHNWGRFIEANPTPWDVWIRLNLSTYHGAYESFVEYGWVLTPVRRVVNIIKEISAEVFVNLNCLNLRLLLIRWYLELAFLNSSGILWDLFDHDELALKGGRSVYFYTLLGDCSRKVTNNEIPSKLLYCVVWAKNIDQFGYLLLLLVSVLEVSRCGEHLDMCFKIFGKCFPFKFGFEGLYESRFLQTKY